MKSTSSLPTCFRAEAAERALHDGDHEPRLRTWSVTDPVTLFGAFGIAKVGATEVREAHRWVASNFSDSSGWMFELVAAGATGDLAYTVGYERHTTFEIETMRQVRDALDDHDGAR